MQRRGGHLTVPGSALWRERLAFRDALRADAALAKRYEILKRRLYAGPQDPETLSSGKRPFVCEVLATAGIDLA